MSWEPFAFAAKHDQTESIQCDWMQANWEILVEGILGDSNIVLEIYGEGADCHGEGSRVLYPERLATHRIVCVPKNDERIYDYLCKQNLNMGEGDVIFEAFVCLTDNGWYSVEPSFDHVLAMQNGNEVVMCFEKIEFELDEMAPMF